MRKAIESCQLNEQAKTEKVAAIPMGTQIPKIIHQTHYSKDFPPEISLNIQKIKMLNPNWTYCFYDDMAVEEYIRSFFPDLFSDYLAINPSYGPARADLFRYLLLYREGGVYLDIKSSSSKPLDNVILESDRMVLSHWNTELFAEGCGRHPEIDNPEGEFQQWFIIAAPGHPFLKSVIENVLRNIGIYCPDLHGKSKQGVLRVTGPIAYTLAIAPLLDQYPYRLVRSYEDLGLIYSLYDNVLPDGHYKLSPIHYSKLEEPIVTHRNSIL